MLKFKGGTIGISDYRPASPIIQHVIIFTC